MYMYVKVLRDIEKWKQLKAEWLGKLSCIHSMAYRSFLKGASEECIITFYWTNISMALCSKCLLRYVQFLLTAATAE